MIRKFEYRIVKNVIHDEDGNYQDGWLVVDQNYDGDEQCDYYAHIYDRKIGKYLVKALERGVC